MPPFGNDSGDISLIFIWNHSCFLGGWMNGLSLGLLPISPLSVYTVRRITEKSADKPFILRKPSRRMAMKNNCSIASLSENFDLI